MTNTDVSTTISRKPRTISGAHGGKFQVSSATVAVNVAFRIHMMLGLTDNYQSQDRAFAVLAALDIPTYYGSLDTPDRWGSINEFWQWVVAEQPLTEDEVAEIRRLLIAETNYEFGIRPTTTLVDMFDGQLS